MTEKKSVKPHGSSSVWKFCSEDQENANNSQALSFKLQLLNSDSNNVSSTEEGVDTSVEEDDTHKKKKRKLRDIEGDKMAKVLDDMEEEIERQLDSKAQKSNLTVANVKNILKSVISNEDVMTMVRQSLQRNGEIECPYEPKLTRAKTKELLKLGPVPTVVPGIWGLNLNKKVQSSKVLIEEEFSEDSSDEEYKPNEEEQSDDEDNKSESMRSDLESQPCTPVSVHCTEKNNEDWTDDGVFRIPQENIGQRTRSKLSLSSTPLEAIEQAFVPPDITLGMYDSACDNDDWINFLKEFTQPLENDNNEVVDDVEEDPEYNVLADEEAESVDKEELRMDRAVKVSRKELNALMAELFEYTDMMSSDDEDNPQESSSQLINTLNASALSDVMDEKDKENVALNESETEGTCEPKNLELTYAQRLLLCQQMRQHVQLLIQHFLLTYKHPTLGHLAAQCKSNLVTLKHLAKSETSAFHAFNLPAALEAMEVWETILAHPSRGKNIIRFMNEEMTKYDAYKAKRQLYQCRFPRQLISLVARSEAFVYPLLLPPMPFVNSTKQSKVHLFTSSETMLIALCLEQLIPYMKANPKLYKRAQIPQLASLIAEITMPECSPTSIKHHIKSMKLSSEDNPIKIYYETGKAPNMTHYIIPVVPGIKLLLQPKELVPAPWKNLIKLR